MVMAGRGSQVEQWQLQQERKTAASQKPVYPVSQRFKYTQGPIQYYKLVEEERERGRKRGREGEKATSNFKWTCRT